MEWVVVDLETEDVIDAQHDFRFPDIYEIGAVLVEDWRVIQDYQTLVQPSALSTRVKPPPGVTISQLRNAPTFDNIFDNFREFINQGSELIHWGGSDFEKIQYQCFLHEIRWAPRKGVVNLQSVYWAMALKYGWRNSKSLDAVCKYFDIETKGMIPHRALVDALRTAKVGKRIFTENEDVEEIFLKEF